MKLLHYFLLPARGGAAALIVVFAVLLWTASHAGLLGLPLGLILISWFFKYCFILFDHVVRGYDEPPTLDISMVNPVGEFRPLWLVVIVVLAGVAVTLASRGMAPVAAAILAASLLAALPASTAVLGLEGNVVKALYPVALVRLIRGLGSVYVAVLAAIGGAGVLLVVFGRLQLWMPVSLAVGMFAVLSVFSGLAGALYERRHELGLETWHSPERTEEKQRQRDLQDDERRVTEAYGLVRVRSHQKAWESLQAFLNSRDHRPEAYRWLLTKVASWPDPRYATRLAEEQVERLLGAKSPGQALDAVRERLRVDPTFRPKSAASTLRIAQLAAGGGGAIPVARTLLSDFAERFAGDPLVESAKSLAGELER